MSFLILVRNLSGKQTFQSFLLSLVTHLLLGSTFRDFSWGTEVVQCLTLIHNAATIIQLHCNCSSHARMQVGLCYCTSHQFIQTPTEETFFCLKSRVKKTKQKISSCTTTQAVFFKGWAFKIKYIGLRDWWEVSVPWQTGCEAGARSVTELTS